MTITCKDLSPAAIIKISGHKKTMVSQYQLAFERKDLMPRNLPRLFKIIRSEGIRSLVVHFHDLTTQHNLFYVKAIALLSGVKHIKFEDNRGVSENIKRLDFLLKDLPLFWVGLLYCLLVVLLFVLGSLFLKVALLFPRQYNTRKSVGQSFCYLKTDFWYGLKVGGSVTHTQGLINAVRSLGYPISVISADPLSNYALKAPIHVIKPSKLLYQFPQKISQMEYNFRFFLCSLRLIRRAKPFMLYQRNTTNNYSGALISRAFHVPLVLEYNGSSHWVAKNWQQSKFTFTDRVCEQISLREAYRIAVVSNQLKQTLVLKHVPLEKILVNPNGVDPEQFNDSHDPSPIRSLFPSNKTLVGFIGIFGQWHGVLTLAASVRHVIRQDPNVHFVIIGEGELKDRMIEIFQKDETLQYVSFVGVIMHKDVPLYLSACDILVSPHQNMADGSTFFGSPTKIFEYMSMGKAIVASRVGQLEEILQDGVNAVLVEQKNEQDLARGIILLVRNPRLRKKMGARARDSVLANYTWYHNAQRILPDLPER